MSVSTAPQYGTVAIGNLRYGYESNPDAMTQGRATSLKEHVEKLGATTEFSVRLLQIMDKGFAALYHFFPKQPFAKLSAKASLATQALVLPRLYGATKEMVDHIHQIHEPLPSHLVEGSEAQSPSGEQVLRKWVKAICKIVDAVATYSAGVGIVAEQVFKAGGVAKGSFAMADGFSLVNNTCEAQMAAEDFSRSRLAAIDLAQVCDAPADVVKAAEYTNRLSMIRLAQSVLAMAAEILCLGTLVFKGLVVAPLVPILLPLAVPILALSAKLYEQSMPSKPLNMFTYYNGAVGA